MTSLEQAQKDRMLIAKLSENLAPVIPLYNPNRLFALWLITTFVFVSPLLPLIGTVRHNAHTEMLSSPRLIFEILCGYLSAFCAGWSVLQLSVPGRGNTFVLKVFGMTPFILFCSLNLYGCFFPAMSSSWDGWRLGCEREILAYSVAPLVVGYLFISRALPLDKPWSVLLLVIASMMPAVSAMQLACMYHPVHILLFHVLPVFVVGAVGIGLRRRFFNSRL